MAKSKRKSKKGAKPIVSIIIVMLVVVVAVAYLLLKGPTTICFALNYDGETKEIQVSFGEEIDYEPTREGYTFEGWYIDEACTEEAQISFFTYFSDKTFYAKWKANTPTSTVASGDFSAHFLELGNIYTGDSIYIKAGDVDILIDAGSRQSSAATICDYVDQYCTDGVLEYVIVTHADQDHISGFVGTTAAEGIFDHYECETIIQFALTNKDTQIYKNYCTKRNTEVENGANLYFASDCFNETNGAKREYQLTADISFEVLYNYYYFNNSSDENNYSVCVMFHQGDNNYLFTGDLEKSGEEKMVEYYDNQNDPLPHCVLYKAGHHGSGTSSTQELLDAITPEYVCICCCAGSSEYTSNEQNQFPYQAVIDRLAKFTDKIYVTTVVDNYVSEKWSSNGTVKSMNGNIVFSCNDGVVEIHGSNNDLKLKETEWFKENRTWPSDGV